MPKSRNRSEVRELEQMYAGFLLALFLNTTRSRTFDIIIRIEHSHCSLGCTTGPWLSAGPRSATAMLAESRMVETMTSH